MTKKEVRKAITVSEIRGAKVTLVNAAPVTEALEPVKVFGEISDRKAVRVLRDKNPSCENVILLEVVRETITYSMSFEDFAKHGTPVETSSED